MMTIFTSILEMVLAVVPQLTTSEVVGRIITTLQQLLPVLIKEYRDLLPIVKNIITALKSNGMAVDAQLDALDLLDAQVDTAFETAAQAALKEDADAEANEGAGAAKPPAG